jgi:hypothetical protein
VVVVQLLHQAGVVAGVMFSWVWCRSGVGLAVPLLLPLLPRAASSAARTA